MIAWTRLIPSGELRPPPVVPSPSPLAEDPRSRFYEAQGSAAAVGKGLERHSEVNLLLRAEFSPGGADVFAAGDPLGVGPGSLLATSARPWLPGELSLIEEEASRILVAHSFPADRDLATLRWAWDGADLQWAPAHGADTSGKRGLVNWEAFRRSKEYFALWPRWGAFDWAEHVWRQRAARAWAQKVSSSQQEWEAAFQLGVYLGEADTRRRYAEEKVRGGQKGRATWTAPALEQARVFRVESPSLGQGRLAEELKAWGRAQGLALPAVATVVDTIAQWERSGKLMRSSQNPGVTGGLGGAPPDHGGSD